MYLCRDFFSFFWKESLFFHAANHSRLGSDIIVANLAGSLEKNMFISSIGFTTHTHTHRVQGTGFISGQHQHPPRPCEQASYGKIRGTHTPSPLSAVFKAAALQTRRQNAAAPASFLHRSLNVPRAPLPSPTFSPLLAFMLIPLLLNIGRKGAVPYLINPSNVRLSEVDRGKEIICQSKFISANAGRLALPPSTSKDDLVSAPRAATGAVLGASTSQRLFLNATAFIAFGCERWILTKPVGLGRSICNLNLIISSK